MKTMKTPLLLLAAVMSITSINARAAAAAAPECAPGVQDALKTSTYKTLLGLINPKVATLKTQLAAVSDQTSYNALLATATGLAAKIPTGRVVVALPDGTVMVDTGKPVDPLDAQGSGNSYNHYKTKTVNENHNTRLAIINAQLHPCGVGVETKLSTTVKAKDSYVAVRLGTYLDSVGTARISITK